MDHRNLVKFWKQNETFLKQMRMKPRVWYKKKSMVYLIPMIVVHDIEEIFARIFNCIVLILHFKPFASGFYML